MADSLSPLDVCASIYELATNDDDINMWPEDSSHITGDCGDSSTGIMFDADCSQQFHDLAIDRKCRTYSVNDGDNDPAPTDPELVSSMSLSSSSPSNKPRLSKSSSSITTVTVGSSRSVIRCGICSKTFNNSSALAKHKLIHSDERKYTCSQCSKSFKRQDHLNGHMMTHSTKKPYECKFLGCDKSYCDARSLRRHYDNHHHHLLETCSSAASTLTPRSAIADNSGSAGQRLIFNFDFAGGSPSSAAGGLTCPPLSGSDASLTTDPTSPLSSVSPGGPSNQLPPGIWTGDGNPFDEPKPIQCSICDKRFKNLPALNGHMRLHGGYKPSSSEADKAQILDTQSANSTAVSALSSLHSEPATLIEATQDLRNSVEQESHWLERKPAATSAVDIQAVLVDSCQILNPNIPTLYISHPTSNCDTSNTVFMELDTGRSASNDCTPVAEVDMQTTLSEQYTLTIDQTTTGHSSSLPLLLGTENIEVMLADSSTAPIGSGLDSSYISCPIITSNDSLAGLHMTSLPTSTIMLFSPTHPPLATQAVRPVTAYKILNDSAAFPSLSTPRSSSILITSSLQEHRVSQVNNPTPSTPTMWRAAHPSPKAVNQSMFGFPTALTPGQTQLKTPTSSASFKISSSFNASQITEMLSLGEAPLQSMTPIYTVALSQPPVGPQLFSPRTPYTPATPSIFQFPPTSSNARESSVNCSSPYVVQKHYVSYHPYSQSVAGELRSPHIQRLQQQAAIRKAEERKKFEQDVAEAHLEIEFHLNQLKQEDMVRQQQHMPQPSVVMISESQAVVSIASVNNMAYQFVPPNDGAESTIASFNLVQQVDDVLQVLAEQADDMDIMQGEDSGNLNPKKEVLQTVVCPLQTVSDGAWVADFKGSISNLPKPKRKQKPEPLIIPDSMSNFRQLANHVVQRPMTAKRNLIGGLQVTPYTPPPMRSPLWIGSGLSRSLLKSGVPMSAPPGKSSVSATASPENINGTGETLIWDPKIVEGLTDEELLNYQNFACCAALPGSGTNREYALHLLQMCNGRIKAAQLKLMHGGPRSNQDGCREEWSPDEVNIYSQALIETDKDFNVVAKKVGSKSVKQCVQFYYMWKKVCSEEYELLCCLHRQRRNLQSGFCENMQTDELVAETCRPSLITGSS